jgi:hypothetical protein
MKILSFLACLLLLSCEQKSASYGPPPVKPRIVAAPSFKVGELNQKGRLIFWSIDAYDHEEPFALHEDAYGVVLYNDGSEAKPQARYIFASQRTREIVNTDDLTVFKQALAKVPRGTKVGCYDTCTMPRSYGLPQQIISRFYQALTKAGLTLEEETRRVCYCPMGGS